MKKWTYHIGDVVLLIALILSIGFVVGESIRYGIRNGMTDAWELDRQAHPEEYQLMSYGIEV